MRKLVITLISLALFATACGGDGGDAFDPNPNVAAGTLEEITVTDFGSVSPENRRYIVTIDSAHTLEMTREDYERFDTLVDSCTVTAELSESDYEALVAAVAAADLANYVPPTADECEPLIGTQGYGIDYRTVEGGVFNIDLGTCPLDDEINELISEVMGLVGQYFADFTGCSDDNDDDDDKDKDKDGDDSDVVIYRVPIINPTQMPRPTRVKF
jgi:hypothetical protein